MSYNLGDVDFTGTEELSEGYRAAPPGEYQLYLENSEKVTTKAGTGSYLKCIFVIAVGPYEGTKIFQNFNIWNPSVDAVRIAKSQWAAIVQAAYGGPVEQVKDSAQIHNRIFFAELDNVPAYNKETDKNDHPTYRSNEIVFKKDKIRPLNSTKPVASVAPTPAPFAAPVQVAPQPSVQPAAVVQPVQQQIPANAPPLPRVGGGKPPWQK